MWTTDKPPNRTKNMKLKAVVFDNCPQALTDSVELMRPDVMREVWIPHLKVPLDFGPAEGYIQVNDISRRSPDMAETDGMCNIKLTEVSGPTACIRRSIQDFYLAVDALTDLYRRKIKQHLPRGHRIQLFVVIVLDEKIPVRNKPGEFSPLVEGNPEWVEGEADLPLAIGY